MNVRTEAEIVKNTLAILEQTEAISYDIAERIESRMAIKTLREKLEPFKSSTAIATQESLDVLKDFLRKRAKRLLGTPTLYCYQQKSVANRACTALAEDLATIFPYRELKLLMPNVVIPADFVSKQYNDFVVTPDGYLIPLLAGLDAARADKNHNYYHPSQKNADGQSTRLPDVDLLIDHSTQAWRYSMTISNLVGKPSQDEIATCDEARKELIDALDGSCIRRAPAHKEAGKNRLMASLTKNIHSLQQLAEFMDNGVHQFEWDEFLQQIDREELYRIVIPMRNKTQQKPSQTSEEYKTEQAILAAPAMNELITGAVEWPKTDNAKRALCYVMAFVQHELRDAGPQFTGWTTSVVGRAGATFFKQKNKVEALSYTQTIKVFLQSENDLRDIDKYIAEKKLAPISSGTTWHLKEKIVDAGRQCSPVPALV